MVNNPSTGPVSLAADVVATIEAFAAKATSLSAIVTVALFGVPIVAAGLEVLSRVRIAV